MGDIITLNESIAQCSECGETNQWIIFLDRKQEIKYFQCACCGGIWELEEDE